MTEEKRLNCDEKLPEPTGVKDFDNLRNLNTCLRMPNLTPIHIAKEDAEIAVQTGILKSNRTKILDIKSDREAVTVC